MSQDGNSPRAHCSSVIMAVCQLCPPHGWNGTLLFVTCHLMRQSTHAWQQQVAGDSEEDFQSGKDPNFYLMWHT